MNSSKNEFNFAEIGKRLVKYIIEGLAVAIVAYIIPRKDGKGSLLEWQEVLILSLVAAATFAGLDFYAPSVGTSARQGAGFGIGASIVGWPAPMMV